MRIVKIGKFFLLTCIFLISAANTQAQIKLYVFDVGDIFIHDISHWNPGVDVGKSIKFSSPSYLIRHPKGDLIWDTGLEDSLALWPNGRTTSLMTMKLPRTLSSQLEEIHVSPLDIEFLAFSHLHSDHIGNANLFLNATLIVQEEEYKSMFEGAKVLPQVALLKDNLSIKLTGDHDVFGDGTVIVKRAPGHTAGHQVLFVKLEQAGPIVLSGDLYHFSKNRVLRGVPEFNFSKEQTLRSMDLIEKFMKDAGAVLWIQHDIELFKSIPHAPEVIR